MKHSVLIVEDELIVAEDLRGLLLQHGYKVLGVVQTGADAIRHVKQSTPSVVLMDMQLKGEMDGLQTAKMILNADHGSTRVVFLTGHSPAYPANVQLPCFIVQKPYSEDEILTLLREILE